MSQTIKNKYQTIATWLAFAVIPISGLATDIYLPSMPSMALDIGVTNSQIQLTISLFLISYGIVQFVGGALIDAYGRYKISTASLLLFVLSFVITANIQNIYVIYLMRIMQGALAGLAIVAKRAYFVDVYQGNERKHYLSIMTIVWSLGPIIAPFLGGYIQTHLGWKFNFYFLALYCLILFLLELIFSGETLKIFNPININYLKKEFKKMIGTSDFMLGILMCGFSYGIVIYFGLSAPFIIEKQFHFTPVITGYAALLMGLAWMSGGFLGRFLINRPFLPKLIKSSYLQVFFAIVMLFAGFQFNNIFTLLLFAFLVHTIAGFLFNNYLAYCLNRFPNNAGIAGGITGGIAFILTSAISYGLVALIQPQNIVQIAIGYTLIALACLAIIHWVKSKKAVYLG